MKRLYWLLLLVPLAIVGIWWSAQARSSAPEVRFVRPTRETLISDLPTNGKVEPIEWSAVRVDAPGLVTKLPVRQGQSVAKGALLAQLSAPGVADQIAAARARVTQAQSELDVLGKGGRSTELADIENRLNRARFDRDQSLREYNSLRRLADKQAATAVEVAVAQARVRQSELQIQSLEAQRAALVSKSDLSASQARLSESQASERAIAAKLGQGIIRSPLAGVVYDLPARLGSYLNPGDLVASVGQIDRLRVRVYVDEPELGRVAAGQPVTITWDALPGKTWAGTVERLATQITPLGTRQVGEVLCTIDNPGHELVPGTNINADIQTNVVSRALTLPKEAIRRENGYMQVYILANGDRLRRRKVETGASSITRTAVTGGISENDAVALPADRAIKEGDRVKPTFP